MSVTIQQNQGVGKAGQGEKAQVASLANLLATTPMLMEERAMAQLLAAVSMGSPLVGGVFDATAADMTISDGVAQIGIGGPMSAYTTRYDKVYGGTGMDKVQADLQSATANQDVKSILLVIDSPGGTVAGTAALAEAVKQASNVKPVIVFGQNIVASAAYYVAAGASKIVVDPNTFVGSIGVRTELQDWSRMLDRAGVTIEPIGTAPAKTGGHWATPITDAVRQDVRRQLDSIMTNFSAAVSAGRNLKGDALAAVTDARIHIGADAVKLGLADAVGNYADALALAKSMGASKSKQHPLPGGRSAGVTQQGHMARKEGIMPESNSNAPAETQPTASATSAGGTQAGTGVVGEPITATLQVFTPAAATMSELRAGCPKAPDSFLVDAADKKMTLVKAKDAYISFLVTGRDASDKIIADQKAAHATEIAAKDAKIAELTKKVGATGGLVDTTAADANPAPAVGSANDDPKTVAKREWEADAKSCRTSGNFISEKAYVGYRAAEIRGSILGK